MIQTSRSEWMWRVLHFLSVLMVPVILTALMSCIKAKEEKADLGPEIPAEQIDRALSKAVSGATLEGFDVGRYTSFSTTRRLEAEESTINMGYTKVKVIGRKEETDSTVFTLKVERAVRMADNSFDVKVNQEPIIFDKSAPVTPSSIFSAQASAMDSEKKLVKTSFHRLRESEGQWPVPAAVKGRSGCGGLSPCEIPVNIVQFDLVSWFNDGTYQKFAIDLAISTKTPLIPFGPDPASFDRLNGLIVSDCRATQVPIEGRTVYIRDCLNFDDFQK